MLRVERAGKDFFVFRNKITTFAEVEKNSLGMNENLNLCKILKDCPKGKPFWSPCWGKVTFEAIDALDGLGGLVYVQASRGVHIVLNGDGKLDADGECMIFPSKDQRDWSKFKLPIERFDPKEFKTFEEVLIRDGNKFKWVSGFFESLKRQSNGRLVVELRNGRRWKTCIPYNDETKHLSGTTDNCPEYYKWWEE